MDLPSLSDLGLGIGTIALIAFGWDHAPEAQAQPQAPSPELTLTMLHERHVADRRCEAHGIMRNSGSAGSFDGELRLTFFAAEDGDTYRVVTAGRLQIANLAPAETQPFTVLYDCDDAIGSRRYRAYAAGVPVPVRAGLRRIFAGA